MATTLSVRPDRFQALTMTSREIAVLTGKEHKHVIRDIRAMLDELEKDGPVLDHPQEDKDARGYTTCFYLNRELTDTLLTGYSAIARRAVIVRWHKLEAQQGAPALNTDEGKLLLIQELATKQLALIHENKLIAIERDHAIATKAQIGSKREATAMATASAARKDALKLKDQLGFNARHATVRVVEKAMSEKFAWLPLRKWCSTNGVCAKDVPDPLYTTVKAWPAGAWGAVYGIDLNDLFGATN